MRAVLLYHAAGLIAYHAARFLIIMQRGSISSYSGVIVNHSAGFCFIIPRGYSAGGSALSCRGVIVYHAGVVIVYHAGVVIVYHAGVVIVYHAARVLIIMQRGS